MHRALNILSISILLIFGCELFPTPAEELPPVTETNMRLLWEIPYESAGSGINAAPLILGDSMVVMSAGKDIYMIHQQTGRIIWKYRESNVTTSQTEAYATDGEDLYTTQVQDVRSIRLVNGTSKWVSSHPNAAGGFWTNYPAVKDGRVFASAYASLYCLDANDGDTIWINKFYHRGFISSPEFYENSVILGLGYGFDDSNGVIAGGVSKFMSIDPLTGDIQWTVTAKGDGSINKIIIDEGIVYGGTSFPITSGSFEARNVSNGNLIWSYFTPGQTWNYKDCIVVGDKIIVNTGLGNHIYAFHKKTGALLWRNVIQGDPLQEKQCYYNGYLYITQGWKLYVLDPETGQIVYSLKPPGRSLVKISVGNDKVFVCGFPTLQCYEVYTPE